MRTRNLAVHVKKRAISKALKHVLDQALTLTKQQRVRLLEEVADSLSPETLERDEQEFRAELLRRSEEYMRDPSIGIPAEKVHRDTVRELEKIRQKRRNGKR